MAKSTDYESDFGFENYEDFDFGISSVSQEEYESAKEDVTTAVGASTANLENKIDDLMNVLKGEISQHDHEPKLDEIIAMQKEMKENLDTTALQEQAVEKVNGKLKEVERLIMPLMFNLMKNPENQYIKWPGRKPVIEKQIKKILEVTRGG
tara:strand:+ start:4538 stop:4990 length:453 start_codon:yes stop_codon:yes gene_type:complete